MEPLATTLPIYGFNQERYPSSEVLPFFSTAEGQSSSYDLQEHIITPLQVPVTHISIATWIEQFEKEKTTVTWPKNDLDAEKTKRLGKIALGLTVGVLLISIVSGGIFLSKKNGSESDKLIGFLNFGFSIPLLTILLFCKCVLFRGNLQPSIERNRKTLRVAWTHKDYLTFLDNKLLQVYGPVKKSKNESPKDFALRSKQLHTEQPLMSEPELKAAAEAILIDITVCQHWNKMALAVDQTSKDRYAIDLKIETILRETHGLFMKSESLRQKRQSLR